MSTPFFWIIFIAALLTSFISTLNIPLEPIAILLLSLFWLGTFTLAYSRWSNRSINWLGRIAALLIIGIISLTLRNWIQYGDVFITQPCGCKPRTATFWPLLFVWLINIGLIAYTTLGSLSNITSLKKATLRSIAIWGIIILWTVGCIYLLISNITTDVVSESLSKAGILIGIIALVVLGFVLLIWTISIPYRRKQNRADADFMKIDEATKQQILDLIDFNAKKGEHFLLYRFKTGTANPTSTAHVGGNTAALPNEVWPLSTDGTPATFLLQIPLVAPRLPAPWQGRLLTVFLLDYEILVRHYDTASIANLITLLNPQNPADEEIELLPLAIPYTPTTFDDEDFESAGFDTTQLIEELPELESKLKSLTEQPASILNKIISGYNNLSSEDTILVGGDPQLIQGPHEPECPVCNNPMRFLLQFCDVTDTFLLGDSGVGYVYGCDHHPDQCIGFIDCH